MIVLEIANVVGKGIQIIPTVVNIAKGCTKKEPLRTDEKIEVAVEIVFCFLQGSDLAFTAARIAATKKVENMGAKLGINPNHIGIGLSAAASGGSIARTI